MSPTDRTLRALDTADLAEAAGTAHGPEGVRKVRAAGQAVFLDLKYHDIPATVTAAVRAAAELETVRA